MPFSSPPVEVGVFWLFWNKKIETLIGLFLLQFDDKFTKLQNNGINFRHLAYNTPRRITLVKN
jgi:hypothetical protein